MSVKRWSDNLKEADHFRDLGVNGRMVIKYII
jgi:hypothetical protein